jgi:Phage integrase family
MLRHACGYALADRGHDTRALQAYLGHRNLQHTVRYTELAPDRFKDFGGRLLGPRQGESGNKCRSVEDESSFFGFTRS